MLSNGFEVFYYSDQAQTSVPVHMHNYYELYFFLEGDVDYQVEDKTYQLQYGDYLLIPPEVEHRPVFKSGNSQYRRLILWLSIEFYETLCAQYEEYRYSFNYVQSSGCHHFRTDFIVFQHIQGQLLEFLEEANTNRPFRDEKLKIMISALLLQLNRITYDQNSQITTKYQNTLYLNICDYINNHLEEDLSLEQLASFFFVSKYHISHIFKENMGLSLHQYIIKKRIHASKNGILSDTPIQTLITQYGFKNYSSFYRAFVKEYGVSPMEYREQHSIRKQSEHETE